MQGHAKLFIFQNIDKLNPINGDETLYLRRNVVIFLLCANYKQMIENRDKQDMDIHRLDGYL